jgi:hypothetical protein
MTDAASSMCLELPEWLLTAGHSYIVGVCGMTPSDVNTSYGMIGYWLSEYTVADHRAGESFTRLLEVCFHRSCVCFAV